MAGVTAVDWGILLAVVVALFGVDLLLATVRPHAVGFGEAAAWSVFFVAAGVGFGLLLAARYGWGPGGQFFTGYIIEKSLSVDNLFVFVIIMSAFAVPREHQQRVLIFGIITSLALRSVFIAIGAVLLSALSFMFVIFGLVLLWAAVQMFRNRNADPDVSGSPLVRVARRVLPVTETFDGGRLVTRDASRAGRVVTPLFLVFIAIGGTDVMFALDSIPAVFGVTDEGYIVFAANAFSLLGLRALFFLVTGLLDRLVYLSAGLAVILAFIGVKLILEWAHGISRAIPEISTAWSLAVIAGVLVITIVASLVKSRRDPGAKAHAGVVIGMPAEKTGRTDDGGLDRDDLAAALEDVGPLLETLPLAVGEQFSLTRPGGGIVDLEARPGGVQDVVQRRHVRAGQFAPRADVLGVEQPPDLRADALDDRDVIGFDGVTENGDRLAHVRRRGPGGRGRRGGRFQPGDEGLQFRDPGHLAFEFGDPGPHGFLLLEPVPENQPDNRHREPDRQKPPRPGHHEEIDH